jgi:NADH-quinone oxidoreductase subunit G
VLGNELGVEGFDYFAAADARRELKEQCRDIRLDNTASGPVAADEPLEGLVRYGDVPMYSVEALVRQSEPLQGAADAGRPCVRLAPTDAERLGVADAERVVVTQDGRDQVLPLVVDERIAEGCAWIPQALEATGTLGAAYGAVSLQRA